jgi:aminoglycoside 3-N-acetyltransferase
MHSREELATAFRRLGVAAGDIVMMHASVRSVGKIAGGPDVIHLALKDALTPDGTLMMYASCPEHVDEVGRGHLSAAEERELLDKLPPFDPLTARSQRENGALVELLRTYPGSVVNAHPARFVVWGRHAQHLISSQPWDFPFGFGSALDRFQQLGGKILLLGCDHDTVTFLHYAEHVVDIPDKRIARFRVPIEENGRRVWREMAEIDTSDKGAHANWPDRFFARLVDTHLTDTHNAGGFVGNARCFLFGARGLLDLALGAMKQVAVDPHAADRLRELQ